MIPGIVDSQNRNSGVDFVDELEPPFWLPDGALIHLDWVNGNFWWDSAIQNPLDGLGGNYDPSDIDGFGLFMRLGANMNGIQLIGSLRSQIVLAMLGGCSMAVDLDADAGGFLSFPEGMIIWFMDNVDPNSINNTVTWEPATSPRSWDMSYPGGTTSGTETMNQFSVQTLAATFNASIGGGDFRWGGSVNAQTAEFEDVAFQVADTESSFPRVDLFAIQEFDFGLEECYVRRFTVYQPKIIAADLEGIAQPYFLPVDPTAVFADVSLLCHFNGTDGATTTSDTSSNGHTVTLSGGAQLDTAQKRFGSAALLFPDDAAAMVVGNNTDFNFGAGPFAIEFAIMFDSQTSGNLNISFGDLLSADKSWSFQFAINFLTSVVDLTLSLSQDGSVDDYSILIEGVCSIGAFHDVVLERDASSVLRLRVDGAIKAIRVLDPAFDLHASSDDLRIESDSTTTDVWLDEMRITKGAFWYGPDYDVPTAEFPDS